MDSCEFDDLNDVLRLSQHVPNNQNQFDDVDEVTTVEDEMALNVLTDEEMIELEESPESDIFTFEPPKVDQVDDTNVVSFDFRSGFLPIGVEAFGEGTVSFEIQPDGSSALVVPEGVSLALDLGGMEGNQGALINEWSLTMDIKLDQMPRNEFSLVQTCGTPDRDTEGEAYIYKEGGVGVFGETGVNEAWIQQGRWSRVVVTLGSDSGDVLYREMKTYVNSQDCATVKRGVFAYNDSRFGVNPNKIVLFGSSNERLVLGREIKLKYVEFRRVFMNKKTVRENSYHNRIFSYWQIEKENRRQVMYQGFSLKSLYRKPPPVWLHPAFLGQFGDAYLEGTGLTGGSIPSSLAMFSLAVNKAFEFQDLFLENFGHEEKQVLDSVKVLFSDAADMSRKWALGCKSGHALVHFMRRFFLKKLDTLKEGEKMIVPGGINNSPMMYILEKEETHYRFVVINTNPLAGLSSHPSTAEVAPKIKYKTCVAIDNIAYSKIHDHMFWAMIFKLVVYQSKFNTTDKLYDLILSWLVEKPYEEAITETWDEEDLDWRSPQRSSTAYFRCVQEAFHYLLRRKGLNVNEAKLTSLSVKVQMIHMANNDLNFIGELGDSDRRIVRMACEQLAYTVVKLSDYPVEGGKLLGLEQLNWTLSIVDQIENQIVSLPCYDDHSSVPPEKLELDDENPFPTEGFFKQPFFDRFIREEDVDGLAGAPIMLPSYVPIDTLQIPRRVENFEEALAAIRYCDKLCTLIMVQPHCIKNTVFLIAGLIEHTFVHVVPVPKPASSPEFDSCPWNTEMRYGVQLDIMILLQRLIEHFSAAAFSIQATRSHDAVRLIVTACIAAIADCVMRKVATDIPSELCLHYNGSRTGMVYGLSTGHLDTQSETIEVHTAELNIARTSVLDYFADLITTPVLSWENGIIEDINTSSWLVGLCQEYAFPTNELAMYVSGEQHLIIKNFPEFSCFRDISFYFKYFQNTDPRAFPGVTNYRQKNASLGWRWNGQVYEIAGYGMYLNARPEPPLTFTHRFPSAATPSFLTDPHDVRTEDDVLHIKNLPDFGDMVGQADSELMISYLTVPYLRIPLILTFFSTEDRIHSLRSKELQNVFDSVLFEPSRYLEVNMNIEPQEVPTRNPKLLATPYGLLLNELHRSPDVVIDSVVSLLQQSLELDTGTVHSSTVPIILYITRLASRVDNYIAFLIDHALGIHETISTPLREVVVSDDVLDTLQEGQSKIRFYLRNHYHKMLEAWSCEAIRQMENKDDDRIVDENTRICCNLFTHILMIFRNVKVEELSEDIVSTLMCCFVFMTTRHAWNMELLIIPETEVFEVLQIIRRRVVDWSHRTTQTELDNVMEAIVRLTSGTGMRIQKSDDYVNRRWAYIRGARSQGRYTVAAARRGAIDEYDSNPIQEVEYSSSLGVEIDFQIIQLTLKSSHLQALDKQIANKPDVRLIFGAQSMQASTIQNAEHRDWFHLIGRSHDLHHWKTPDPRPCILEMDRDYIPGEVEPSEEWIIPIFEPVRLTYMVEPFVLQILLPERALPEDAEVAYMVGVHPRNGGTWKEIFVFRTLRLVHVYNVMSHGRRFYRSLEYTNDVRYTLREMQPAIDDRLGPWPAWERFGAGHPYQQYPDPTSVVITRSWDYKNNLSCGEEQFIPARLLYGLVPSALLDKYLFWQDEDDNIRGYPETGAHIIFVELADVKKVDATGLPGHSAHITRLVKKEIENVVTEKYKVFAYLDQSTLFTEPWIPTYQFFKEIGNLILLSGSSDDVISLFTSVEEGGNKFETTDELFLFVKGTTFDKPEVEVSTKKKTMDEMRLTLLNMLYAKPGSKLHSLSKVLTRIENLSYVLAWTLADTMDPTGTEEFSIDLIQLPRLNISFVAKLDKDGVTRLYSIDHADLFISNRRSDLTTKLIEGIPHSLLLSNANDEIQILTPSIHPVRPWIQSAPFSTELVLYRADADWYNSLDSNYYLYPVHVSLSFMFTQTLSSALYLLLLRFMHRDYDAVFRLINTIGTDTEFSREEQHIFTTLGSCNNDFHPDAHSCRLKISLVTIDAPVVCPWDLTRQMSRYITKLPHVSSTCRLSHNEELQLLEDCVFDIRDPRFDPKKYTVYEIMLVRNRKFYLESARDGHSTSPVFLPPRHMGSARSYYVDISAIMADETSWMTMEVEYAPPISLTMSMVIDTVESFWSEAETVNGSYIRHGFLFIYELLTGTKRAKLCGEDNSRTLAYFLYELLSDGKQPSLMASILNMMIRNPALCEFLPKFEDIRNYKHSHVIKGYPDDEEPESPLAFLFMQIVPLLATQIDQFEHIPTEYPTLPSSPDSCPVVEEGEREWIIPTLSDFSCDSRKIRSIDRPTLELSGEEISAFSKKPIEGTEIPITLENFTTVISQEELGEELVSTELPFDVSAHPQSKSEVALSMINRLKEDVIVHADRVNSGSLLKCKFLLDEHITEILQNPDAERVNTGIDQCQTLLVLLETLRENDSEYVNRAIPTMIEIANMVDVNNEAPDAKIRLQFLLNRYCHRETKIYLEYLFGALLSSVSVDDLQKLNPYYTAEDIDETFDIVVATIFHASRVGVANRCISETRAILDMLEKAKSTHFVNEELSAGLKLKSEALATFLNTERHYIDEESVYDPRFLVFEFTWNIVLRKAQITLVKEFMAALENGDSLVKQMIMGAGKTTVVGPLLTLMLADGKFLVTQVVPPALLEFSRSVMRSTFSSIMYKRIYTLNFDRSSKVEPALYRKLVNAKETKGVVISTPTTIKSIELKFLELLDIITDDSRPRSIQMERDVEQLHKILMLFQEGILVMDEVDLILHPLRSELNFPIGAKHDLDFNPERWKLPIHILDAIFYAERGTMSVGFKESNRALGFLEEIREMIEEGYHTRSLQRNPHVILLNPDWYHDHLKPLMAKWCLLWLESQHCSGLSGSEMESYVIRGYQSCKDDEEFKEKLDKMLPTNIKMLNLCHDWLTSFLPHCLQKIDRVSFGLLTAQDYEKALRSNPYMPRTRAKLGIPFVGKDVPSESSEFAHPDVIIGLTILGYRYEGLRWTDFDDIVKNLGSTLRKEVGPWDKRKSSTTHAKWVKEAGGHIKGKIDYEDQEKTDYNENMEVVSLRLLKRSNLEQMQKLFSIIQYLPDTIHWYLENFIFPAYMRHQIVKLSSCGQELGGDMLFNRRIGFSGTPSDLLPLELGKCGYEKGSDGLMIDTLTSPTICSYEEIEEGWTVSSLLNNIAQSEQQYNALIDTGALITGLSNHQVSQYLLNHGLEWCEGVVYLDDLDRKVILVRATGRVLKLSQCGIPAAKRFAFYDQVHTTGMDIKHVLNAKAVMTLGKDMTFRDYAQGAFRMRGIAKGQTIHVFIIPEIERLINRELKHAQYHRDEMNDQDSRTRLVEITAWLVINSMRSERIQYNQLCIQNVMNIYKKNSFRVLKDNYQSFRTDQPLNDRHLEKAINIFNEPIDFSLEAAVPEPVEFADTLLERLESNKEFVFEESEMEICQSIITSVSGSMLDDSARALDQEMVQQQEEEREQQIEQEQEQEIEIEKYVDLAYSREHEEPTPWLFRTLEAGDPNSLDQFYPVREFHLYKRRPIEFPSYISVSNNYFDKQWSGARRIKNVVMVMEWVPSLAHLQLVPPDLNPLSDSQQEAFFKAIQLFDTEDTSDISLPQLTSLITSATGVKSTEEEVRDRLSLIGRGSQDVFTYDEIREILRSGIFREEEEGRYYVALSLAEAETIRRIMHIRKGEFILDGTDAAIALRCNNAGNWVFDRSHEFQTRSEYQTEVVHQSLRFLNCDMYYNDIQLGTLIRSLQKSTVRERQIFFTKVIGCRRRLRNKWEETPVAKVFTLYDEFHLLKQRAQTARAREAIKSKGILLYDAFQLFDTNSNGYLSAPELYGALEWLGIKNLTPADILDFVSTADMDRDHNISFEEFVEFLRDPDADSEDDDEDFTPAQTIDGLRISRIIIKPKGVDELNAEEERRARDLEELIEMERQMEWEEENKIRSELEQEEDEKDRLLGANPQIDMDMGVAYYDFTTHRIPRGMGSRGDYAYKTDQLGETYMKVYRLGILFLPIPFSSNGNGRLLNRYSVVMQVKVDELPPEGKLLALVQTAKFNEDEAEVYINPQGGIGFGGSFGSYDSPKMVPNTWHQVSVTVDCIEGELTTYLDGMEVQRCKPYEIGKDGRFALQESICLFGSKVNEESRGCNIKSMSFYSRQLAGPEIWNLYEMQLDMGRWECHICTVRNSQDSMQCSVCEAPRQIQSAEEDWSCAVCTLNNPSYLDQCDACTSPKPH